MKRFLKQSMLALGLLSAFFHVSAVDTTYSAATRDGQADWTIVSYIQADNNLAPYAVYNINDMQLAPLSSSVNMLVQWDQPNNNKTWRYRIVKGGRIEDASLSTEMGLNPVQELIDMAKWAKTKYDAKHFCIVLWNHGSGIIDPRFRSLNKAIRNALGTNDGKQHVPWLEIPGLTLQRDPQERGILFDDSQDTYVNSQGLSTAFSRIKKEVLNGKNVDIVGMDACLMAMLEVGYQIKDSADYLVASEQTEPGEGWAYSGFLKLLCANSTMEAPTLTQAIVAAYANFYKNRARDYTQSAMDLNKLEGLKQNISQLILAVDACKKIDSSRTKKAVIAARRSSITFDTADYIDLYSFYNALAIQFKTKDTPEKSFGALDLDNIKVSPSRYSAAAANVQKIVVAGMQLILSAVTANSVGVQFTNAKGISIYYPRGTVHTSYFNTKFAQNTNWVSFVQTYR
jgi:hypothetical protein